MLNQSIGEDHSGGLRQLMWRRLEGSYTFLSQDEGPEIPQTSSLSHEKLCKYRLVQVLVDDRMVFKWVVHYVKLKFFNYFRYGYTHTCYIIFIYSLITVGLPLFIMLYNIVLSHHLQ